MINRVKVIFHRVEIAYSMMIAQRPDHGSHLLSADKYRTIMNCPRCKNNKIVATDSKDKAGFEFRCLECDHRWST